MVLECDPNLNFFLFLFEEIFFPPIWGDSEKDSILRNGDMVCSCNLKLIFICREVGGR